MSCTVVAVPLALSWVIHAVAVGGLVAGVSATAINRSKEFDIENLNSEDSITLSEISNFSQDCEDVKVLTTDHFMEQTFETPFVDKDLLVKTLREHGVNNIYDEELNIFGSIDNYNLTFNRNSSDQPFSLKISCKQSDNANEKVDDLNSEYALNVQEDAYLRIIEKLKENNMQIEEEVVEDDNTIVLTVNIEQ